MRCAATALNTCPARRSQRFEGLIADGMPAELLYDGLIEGATSGAAERHILARTARAALAAALTHTLSLPLDGAPPALASPLPAHAGSARSEEALGVVLDALATGNAPVWLLRAMSDAQPDDVRQEAFTRHALALALAPLRVSCAADDSWPRLQTLPGLLRLPRAGAAVGMLCAAEVGTLRTGRTSGKVLQRSGWLGPLLSVAQPMVSAADAQAAQQQQQQQQQAAGGGWMMGGDGGGLFGGMAPGMGMGMGMGMGGGGGGAVSDAMNRCNLSRLKAVGLREVSFVSDRLKSGIARVHAEVHALLRAGLSGGGREPVVSWLSYALMASAARASTIRMARPTPALLDAYNRTIPRLAGDEFLCTLAGTLLKLSQPFLASQDEPTKRAATLTKLDPMYYERGLPGDRIDYGRHTRLCGRIVVAPRAATAGAATFDDFFDTIEHLDAEEHAANDAANAAANDAAIDAAAGGSGGGAGGAAPARPAGEWSFVADAFFLTQ
jgi:hypothetical protein